MSGGQNSKTVTLDTQAAELATTAAVFGMKFEDGEEGVTLTLADADGEAFAYIELTRDNALALAALLACETGEKGQQ